MAVNSTKKMLPQSVAKETCKSTDQNHDGVPQEVRWPSCGLTADGDVGMAVRHAVSRDDHLRRARVQLLVKVPFLQKQKPHYISSRDASDVSVRFAYSSILSE